MADDPPTFVVLGAGAMGRIAVRDLVESVDNRSRIVVADVDAAVAHRVARTAAAIRKTVQVNATRVDVRDAARTSRVLRDVRAFGVINATQHQFNISAMRAALLAKAHYCDLGGLFHHTRRQLEQHGAWKKADRLALLGIGAAPGIVNVLARSAADSMEEVHEIHVFVGSVDRTPGRPAGAMNTSYSIQTVLEEASLPAPIVVNGKLRFAPPMSDAQDVDFPEPVGRRQPALTIHSEVATLPLSYRARGLRECSFRIAFPRPLVERLELLRSIGMLSTEPLAIDRRAIVPRDFLLEVLRRLPPAPKWDGVPDEYEVLRVVVRGVRHGARIEETIDCHTTGMPAWKVGIDVDTGCPPSIAMQMLARGEITARGCLPPERAIPAEPFFTELERRRMSITRVTVPWPQSPS